MIKVIFKKSFCLLSFAHRLFLKYTFEKLLEMSLGLSIGEHPDALVMLPWT